MVKLFLILLLSLILSSCSTTRIQKSNLNPNGDCLKFAAQNNIEAFKNNLKFCLEARSREGTTPLMIASAKGHQDMLTELLRAKVDVNAADNQGDTALNYAVVGNRVETVLYLLLNGADVASRRPDKITSLMQATQFGSYEMVKALSQDRAAVNVAAEDGWTAMYFAIRRQDRKILDLLIQQGACITKKDKYDQTPIDFAEEVKWSEGLQVLRKLPRCKSS